MCNDFYALFADFADFHAKYEFTDQEDSTSGSEESCVSNDI